LELEVKKLKLSTKGRYGIRAMLDIAIHGSEGHVTLKSIAQRQNISESYLEQLMAALRKSGLVSSIRGAQGGYKLNMDLDKITVGFILRTMEGSLAPVDCVIEDNPAECENSDSCVTRLLWKKIRDSINNVIDNITLLDLVNQYKESDRT